jgi:hypothetical protein
VSVPARVDPTGVQSLPPLADSAVAPASPTTTAACVVLKAAERMRLADGWTEVNDPPPFVVRIT